jgi:hypothetical protein
MNNLCRTVVVSLLFFLCLPAVAMALGKPPYYLNGLAISGSRTELQNETVDSSWGVEITEANKRGGRQSNDYHVESRTQESIGNEAIGIRCAEMQKH